MNRRTKATSIPEKVKKAVYERDNHSCVVCGAPGNPWCHILSRAHSGMGIETNLVTLCNSHHHLFDEGSLEERKWIGEIIEKHMKSIYGESWCKEDQAYKKWG